MKRNSLMAAMLVAGLGGMFCPLWAKAEEPAPVATDSVQATPVPATTTPPVTTTAPATTTPAPDHIRPGDKLYVPSDDFGLALSGAILKKKVQVAVVTDSTKADFWLRSTSKSTKEGGAERVAKVLAFGFGAGSGTHFDAAVTIANRDGVIVFAHNSKKGDFQSAAQNVASKLKNHIEEGVALAKKN